MIAGIPTYEEIRALEMTNVTVRNCRQLQRMNGLSEEEALRLMVANLVALNGEYQNKLLHEIQIQPYPELKP